MLRDNKKYMYTVIRLRWRHKRTLRARPQQQRVQSSLEPVSISRPRSSCCGTFGRKTCTRTYCWREGMHNYVNIILITVTRKTNIKSTTQTYWLIAFGTYYVLPYLLQKLSNANYVYRKVFFSCFSSQGNQLIYLLYKITQYQFHYSDLIYFSFKLTNRKPNDFVMNEFIIKKLLCVFSRITFIVYSAYWT